MDNNSIILLVVAIAGGLFLIWMILYFIPIGLWFQALVSDVKISLLQLVLMRWRKVPPSVIVGAMIEGKKAGLELYRDLLEAHYLAGGHVPQVVHALVSASKANIDLTFQIATAVDLAGRDVFEAVQMSVNPKVINTPPVTAVAKDGIQLIAKARVTVRANIKRLVGGAGEETILARVGEGIVSSIGSSDSHKAVMENPDFISKVVLDKGLDSGTAFEILSIDIADIDVGKNIGAGLQIDQADADLKIAQAKAEERRAMAVAKEQEMKALAQEMKAKVIEAEAHVPLAMAEAFRSGNLGVMDYYRMKNIEADTQMREAISKPEGKKKNRQTEIKKGKLHPFKIITGQIPQIISGCHGFPISARGVNHNDVSAGRLCQRDIFPETVGRFANRSYNVIFFLRQPGTDIFNLMKSLVKGRA